MGVSGKNIQDGDQKAIMTIVWQLVRLHYLQIVGGQTEEQILKWANDLVKEITIKNFKDPALKSGKWLIKLCAAIEPRAVDWDIVTEGETEEDQSLNAKYVISIARKFGCIIFCVHEDITKVSDIS